MKTFIFFITMILTLCGLCTYAQAPEKIKYQAVARDNAGNVLSNQLVSFRISILQSTSTGTSVYSETFQVTTNELGLTNLNIGNGTIVSGDFSSIEWSSDLHFLQVEMDETGGTTYQLMGTSQLLSVPYALHAKTADSVAHIDNFSWSTTGNSGTNPNTNFIGTTDDQPLRFKVNNMQAGEIDGENTFYGYNAGVYNSSGTNNTATGGHALFSNTTGDGNTVNGFAALTINTTGSHNTVMGLQSMYYNTTGSRNTAIGTFTLLLNVTGNNNTAIGYRSLYSNTEGSYNTAIGRNSLHDNTSGTDNTATGYNSLGSNISGIENTSTGSGSLYWNTTGVANTSTGFQALNSNTTGNHNTATGKEALYSNSSGQRNTAIGSTALHENETGNDNTSVGFNALYNNVDGNENTAVGRGALFTTYTTDYNTAVGKSALYYNNGHENTAVGYKALVNNTSGDGNVAVGFEALANNPGGIWNTAIGYHALSEITSGHNNIGVGYNSQVQDATGSNQVRIGNEYISHAGIQISWSITSDKKWKEQIRELPYGIDMLMQLKPVDYYRKNNEVKTREMGFIAQDVEVLLKEMGYDDQGFLTKADNGNLSLRYNDFIALLTKGMQEQQEMIDQQKTLIEELISRIEKLENNNY